jgi:hypothetical protein
MIGSKLFRRCHLTTEQDTQQHAVKAKKEIERKIRKLVWRSVE